MKLSVIGTGYVGLVVGACFASSANRVICADIDERKIEGLKEGEIGFFEPGLAPIVAKNVRAGRLSFTSDIAHAVRESEVIFIAVGTPPTADGRADLRHVFAAGEAIGDALNGYKVVVMKSTVPVGTCQKLREVIRARTDQPFDVVSNPEFLKEGNAVQDFLKPDRIVVGTDSDLAREILTELYAPFQRRSDRIIFMDVLSSELTKYASNAMLATKISFINEIARLAERVGADIDLVRRGMIADERIGPHFLYPGVGYGGSCFPKDVSALIQTGRERGLEMELLESVERVNVRQKGRLVEMVIDHFGEDLAGRRLAVWGLAFKPGTDDMREAPSLTLIDRLLGAGARVHATDPVAIESARRLLGDRVHFFSDSYEALLGADALCIVTEWPEYRTPDFDLMKASMRSPTIFDGRNLYLLRAMRRMGFNYLAIGRPRVAAGRAEG